MSANTAPTRAIIANQYEIIMPTRPVSAPPSKGPIRPYTLLRTGSHKNDVGREAWCNERILTEYVKQADSVVEYFGGMGVTSVLVQNILHPRSHAVWDIDEGCVEACRAVVPQAHAEVGDWYKTAGTVQSRLAILDFSDFTLLKLMRNTQLRRCMIASLEACQKAVLTDAAISKVHVHLNHYTRLGAGVITNFPSYLNALSNVLYWWTGMSIQAGAYHSGASYLYLEHTTPLASVELVKAPPEAKNWFRMLP